MEEKDIKKIISAMQEVFPTAEMVQRGFQHTADDIKRISSQL
ncbi:MAG: hypothetical protein Q8R40_06155 [bacterium]|nr:hypothetical protein [bacterium]